MDRSIEKIPQISGIDLKKSIENEGDKFTLALNESNKQ